MTDTKAGRALLDAIATNERLSPSGLRMAEYRQAAAAIEREAAQQERERINDALRRTSLVGIDRAEWGTPWAVPLNELNAILAEPSE